MKKLIITAILTAGLLCGCVRSQVPESAPEEISVSVDSAAQLTESDVVSRGAELRKNYEGTVIQIIGEFSDIQVETADDALRCAAQVAHLMSMEEAFPQLRLARSDTPAGGFSYLFKQYSGDAEVVGAQLVISGSEATGRVDNIYSSLKGKVDADPEIVFTAEQAKSLASEKYGEPKDPKLVVYSGRLAWDVELTSSKSEVYELYIDAKDPNGRVLDTEEVIED